MSRRYSELEIERGLVALVEHGGNHRAASRMLELDGLKIPATTLDNWRKRKTYKQRYLDLVAELGPQIRKEAAQRQRALADKAASVTVKIIDKLDAEVDNLETRDLPGAARNMATTSAIGVDKAMILDGEATQRVEIDLAGAVRDLKALGVDIDVVEGEVVAEEKVPELEAENPAGADSTPKPE